MTSTSRAGKAEHRMAPSCCVQAAKRSRLNMRHPVHSCTAAREVIAGRGGANSRGKLGWSCGVPTCCCSPDPASCLAPCCRGHRQRRHRSLSQDRDPSMAGSLAWAPNDETSLLRLVIAGRHAKSNRMSNDISMHLLIRMACSRLRSDADQD